MSSPAFHILLSDATRQISGNPDDARFAVLGSHGSLTVELYQPMEVDMQQPHDRDECYVVTDGTGLFEMGEQTVPFAPGDFIFVPAGMPHRFRDFGRSMTCWVMFYGPEEGEAA